MDTRSQLLTQASQAFNNRDFVNAHKACVTLIRTHGDDAAAQVLEGKIHIELLQFERAIECFERSIQLEPGAEAMVLLARCHSLRDDTRRVGATLSQVSANNLESVTLLSQAAIALSWVGLSSEALPFFQKALHKDGNNHALWYEYAQSVKNTGQSDIARKALEKAIEIKEDYYPAHLALSELSEHPCSDNINRLKQLVRQAAQQKDVDGGLQTGHALTHQYELGGEYDKAYQTLYTAKAPLRRKIGAFEAHVNAIYDWLMDSMAGSQPQSLACQSERPLFIVGMPNTGVRLVERLLTSHSMVARGSRTDEFPRAVADLLSLPYAQLFELPTLLDAEKLSFQDLGSRYLQRTDHWADKHTPFVTDSFPFNFFYLGLIRRALPNARIVCLVRNPLDTCVSSYRRYFKANSPYYGYSYDLAAAGRFYKQFYALMQRWQQHAPDAVRLQSYEALVTQPEQEISDLFDFCGLPRQEPSLALTPDHIDSWKQYAAFTSELENLFSD